jgi:hypothetical protein
MPATWGERLKSFWTSGRNFGTGWMIAAVIVTLYMAAVRPYENSFGINNSKATGLAGDKTEPLGFWSTLRKAPQSMSRARGVIGGIVGDRRKVQLREMAVTALPVDERQESETTDADRKVVRTCALDLVVQKTGEAAEQVRGIAERLGGFLVSSEVRGDDDLSGGALTVRVPAARFEEARAEIRKLALKIENEKIDAEDVTRQYVDQAANLRNLKAEESQYLSILKQAKTVKDTLEVSEKISDVRGRIEQQQAEFETLSKQIETVAISVTLRTQAEARVMGLNWRPLFQLKLAIRDGLDGLANYASEIIAFLFFLPTILLWLATVVMGCALSWKLLRWVGARWFGWKRTAIPVQS